MSLSYVHLEGGFEVYSTSINLEAIEEAVSARLKNRFGPMAPNSGIDWDTIKWKSSRACTAVFIQRNLGENADSIIGMDFNNPLVPKVQILSVKQIFHGTKPE
jgi:hypothetical protein